MTSDATTGALEHIHTWRSRLSDQTIVAASEVQSRLFDLYGDLEPMPRQLERLKPWLSLTVQRELFSASELESFLAELGRDLEADRASVAADGTSANPDAAGTATATVPQHSEA